MISDYIQKCEFCNEKSIFTLPCHFCKKIVCSKEAHYLPSKNETTKGVRLEVLRICPECNPNNSLIT